MDISPRSTKYIDGRQVEVGAAWNRPLQWPHLTVVATCESVSPERYRGEVRAGGQVVVRTDPMNDVHLAQREAERLLTDKLIELLSSE